MDKKRTLKNSVGVVAILILVGMLFVSAIHSKTISKSSSKTENTMDKSGEILIEGDLVCDGSCDLDFMQGVVAKDTNGNDITDKVSATITADSTLYRKKIRYIVQDTSGHTITATRMLTMKDYHGPTITVKDNLTLDSADLEHLIPILQGRGELQAQDGFHKDITLGVTCLREQIAEDHYSLTFTIVNQYQDAKTVTTSATIHGNVENPILELKTPEIQLPKDGSFEPMAEIQRAYDGVSENFDAVTVRSAVDVTVPGLYHVYYELYSVDKTAVTKRTLRVLVE